MIVGQDENAYNGSERGALFPVQRGDRFMELTNTMANIMSLPDRKADYDTACKNVLAEKSILAWIMKCCLDEYRDCSISDIAEQFIEDGSMQIGSAAVYRDEPDKE